MKRIVANLVILVTITGCYNYASQDRNKLPRRIVSLKPNITEILFDLGLKDRIVGVTTFCRLPDGAEEIPRVADYTRANVEAILALKPDLVVTSEENSNRKEIFALKNSGTRVLLLPFLNINDIITSIEKLGKAIGAEERAIEITRQMGKKISEIRIKKRATSNERRATKVMIVVGRSPLIVAGNGTFFDEALKIIGAENIAGESKIRYPNYSTEMLVSSAPDVIIEMTMGSENTISTSEVKKWYKRFPSLPAVKNNHVYFLSVEEIPPSPRIVEGIEKIGRLIHDHPLLPPPPSRGRNKRRGA